LPLSPPPPPTQPWPPANALNTRDATSRHFIAMKEPPMPIAITQPPQNPIIVNFVIGTPVNNTNTATCTRADTGAVLCTNSANAALDAAAALRTAGVDPSTQITFIGPSHNRAFDGQLVDIVAPNRALNGQ
jgi:hypothetical protein